MKEMGPEFRLSGKKFSRAVIYEEPGRIRNCGENCEIIEAPIWVKHLGTALNKGRI